MKRKQSSFQCGLLRLAALAAILFIPLSLQAQNYYVFKNSTYGYLYNNNGSLGAKSDFSPSCVWIASGQLNTSNNRSISSFINNTQYIRADQSNGATVSLGTSASMWRLVTINETECIGTQLEGPCSIDITVEWTGIVSGFVLHQWWGQYLLAATAVTYTTHAATTVAPTISGNVEISELGTNSSFTRTRGASYTSGYNTFAFGGNTYNYHTDNVTSGIPTAVTNFNYTWSMSGIDAQYAEINSSTGVINFKSFPSEDITATVRLTATSSSVSTPLYAEQQVVFKSGLKPTTQAEVDAGTPHLFIIQGHLATSGALAATEYLYDGNDAENHYVARGTGDLNTTDASRFNDTRLGEYGWYLMDAGTESNVQYYYIYNYATGNHLTFSSADNGEHVTMSSAAVNNNAKFSVTSSASGFVIRPRGGSTYLSTNSACGHATFLNTQGNSTSWVITPVNLYRYVSQERAVCAFGDAAQGAISPATASSNYQSNLSFEIVGQSNTIPVTITRPAYQTYKYSGDGQNHYYYYGASSHVLEMQSSAPESGSAWSWIPGESSAPSFNWALAPATVTELNLATATTITPSNLVRQGAVNTSVDSKNATLSAEAVYGYTDVFGNTMYSSPFAVTPATITVNPIMVPRPQNAVFNEGLHNIYQFTNYHVGTLKPASIETGNAVITNNTNLDNPEAWWYFVYSPRHGTTPGAGANNDGSYSFCVVNLFTQQYLYWVSETGDNTIQVRDGLPSWLPTDGSVLTNLTNEQNAELEHYEFSFAPVVLEGNDNVYVRLFPSKYRRPDGSDPKSYSVSSHSERVSDNVNLVDVAGTDPLSATNTYALWTLAGQEVTLALPQLQASSISGNEVLTAEGSYDYAVTFSVTPRSFTFRDRNFSWSPANHRWTTVTPAPQEVGSATEGDWLSIRWTLGSDAATYATLADAAAKTATVQYNTLAASHVEAPLTATLTYENQTFSTSSYNPASTTLTFGGSEAPTAISVEPTTIVLGKGNSTTLHYTLTSNYAHDCVKVHVLSGTENLLEPFAASYTGGAVALTANSTTTGTLTLRLDAYQLGDATVACSSQTVTITLMEPSDPVAFTPMYATNQLKLSNGSELTLDTTTIYYTLDGTTPVYEGVSTSSTMLSGESLSVESLAEGTVVTALSWSSGTAPSLVSTFTVHRYDAPTTFGNLAQQYIEVGNPNTGDASAQAHYSLNQGVVSALDASVPVNGHLDVDALGQALIAFQIYGENKYPSQLVTFNLSRYSRPRLSNYVPYSEQEGIAGSVTLVSNAGSSIAINFSKTDGSNQLYDPNPYDATTYDRIVVSGTTISVEVPAFKAVAFDGSLPTGGNMFPSRVGDFSTSSTNFIALYSKNASNENAYMSVDPNDKSLTTVNQFSYNCLWNHDAEGSIYITLNGIKYYLGLQASNVLTLTTTKPTGFQWIRTSDNGITAVTPATGRGYSVRPLVYTPSNQWSVALGAVGNGSVCFDVNTVHLAPGATIEYDSIVVTDITSDNKGLQPDGYSPLNRKWIAMDESTDFSNLNVSALLYKTNVTYSAAQRYDFVDNAATPVTHEFFYVNKVSYPDRRLTPSSGTTTTESCNDNGTVYEWRLTGDAASCFALQAINGRGYNYKVSRTSQAVTVPTDAQLQVYVTYTNATATVRDTTAVLKLIAETRSNALTTNKGESFNQTRYYRLANYADTNYLLTYDAQNPDQGTANALAISTQRSHGQLWQLEPQTGGYYYIKSPLAGSNMFVYRVNLTDDTCYVSYRAAAAVGTLADMGNTSARNFELHVGVDAAATYFTLHPQTLSYPYSLAPMNYELSDGAKVRMLNSDQSWNYIRTSTSYTTRHYQELGEEVFDLTRWQLLAPKFLVPDVAMNGEGVVTLSDAAADQLGFAYTIQYQLGSGTWITYNPEAKPTLSLNDEIRVRTLHGAAGTNTDYFYNSDISEPFTVHKVAVPQTEYHDGYLTFVCNQDIEGSELKGEIYYTLDGSDPDTVENADHTYHYDGIAIHSDDPYTIRFIGYADNYLKSEIGEYNYKSKLQLSLSVEFGNEGTPNTVVTMEVSNPNIFCGQHYQIHFTTDGSIPSAESRTYECVGGYVEWNHNYLLVRAQAFATSPDGDGYINSDVVTLPINQQRYILTYIGGDEPGDTIFLCMDADGNLVSSNQRPDNSSLWLGPAAGAQPNEGSLFLNYDMQHYLHIDNNNFCTTSDPGPATRFTYDAERNALHRNSDYVVFNSTTQGWGTYNDIANLPDNLHINVCYPVNVTPVDASYEVDNTPMDLMLAMSQRDQWPISNNELMKSFPMNNNWASLHEADTFDFVAGIKVQTDTVSTPDHRIYVISDGAGDETQRWFRVGDRYERHLIAFQEIHSGVIDKFDDNTEATWSSNAASTFDAATTGTWYDLGGYFRYKFLNDRHDTMRVARSATGVTNPDFSTTLGVSVQYDHEAVGSPQTGHLYAESLGAAFAPSSRGEIYAINNCKDAGNYLQADPNTTTYYPGALWLQGEPRITIGSDYTKYALWRIRSTQNERSHKTVVHFKAVPLPDDTLFYLTFIPYHKVSDTAFYFYNPTSENAFNYQLHEGRLPFTTNSTYFDFTVTNYAGGYQTINPYYYEEPQHNYTTERITTRSAMMSSQYRDYEKLYGENTTKYNDFPQNATAQIGRVHPMWTYSQWGEGHNSEGPDVFWASRWHVQSPALLQPTIAMNPEGVVTITNNSTLFNAALATTMTHYYTINDGDEQTYNSIHKPVLNEGDRISVVTRTTTAGYAESPASVLEPTKSATPVFHVDAYGRTTIIHTAGDTVVMSLNNGAPNWDSRGGAYSIYDEQPFAIEPLDILMARSYRTNYFQSDLATYSNEVQLNIDLNYTSAVESSNTPPAIKLTPYVGNLGDSKPPLMGYYNVYWTTDTSVNLLELNQESLPARVHEYHYDAANPEVLNSIDTFPQGRVTIFRAIVLPSGNVTLYNRSAVATKQVAWGYSDTATLRNQLVGAGESAANPYLIRTVGDLLVVARNSTAYRQGKWYRVENDIDATGIELPSIGGNPFKGQWDGNYKVITGLKHPLFDEVEGARIYNVIIDKSQISIGADDDCGAIVTKLSNGDGKSGFIYNCGVLNSDGLTTVTGRGGWSSTGGIAGGVFGTSKVINCYNYASVSGPGNAGGIVGWLDNQSTASNMQTLVYCCMNYGNVNGQNIGPVVGNNAPSNVGENGVNLYNYFIPSPYTVFTGNLRNDGSLAAERRYLNRFEFYRAILNSHADKCTYFITGRFTAPTDVKPIGQWVLDTAIAPYPIVKAPIRKNDHKFYPSVINPDYEAAWRDDAKPYEGRRIKEMGDNGKLRVTIQRGGHGTGSNPAAQYISITDIDTNGFDYNYGKIQLPYYLDYYDYNTSEAYIVTGWEITSVTGGTAGTVPSASGTTPYNFADRNCTAKDVYSNSNKRVFAQGGYYDVPEGVTAITITAHWAKAVYLSDRAYDVKYDAEYANAYNVNLGGSGNRPTTYNGHTVRFNFADAMSDLSGSSGGGAITSVYDQAIVLVGNYHSRGEYINVGDLENVNARKYFTVMSVDDNNDHEPDYCLYLNTKVVNDDRPRVEPICFTNIVMPALGRAAKVNNDNTGLGGPAIFHALGHFEMTETALARYTEFEYDDQKIISAPLILKGGIYDQFVSSYNYGNNKRTTYIHTGGHAYFSAFAQGPHPNQNIETKLCPVSVTGGEYQEFYMTGYYRKGNNTTVISGNGLLYANGGKFGKFASGGQTQLQGDAIVKADHIVADEFYGGGISASQPITGNVDVTLNNSFVKFYSGGPQFGDMASGKTVTTHATGTIFGTYYGAGYGGSSLAKTTKHDGTYGADQIASVFSGQFNDYQVGAVQNNAVAVDYSYDLFAWAGAVGATQVTRVYFYYATLSKSNTHAVNNTLTRCVVNNDFYGAGFVGLTTGTVTTVLDSTIINGDAYGAGNSADVPTCMVYAKPGNANIPEYNPRWLLYSDPDAIHTVGVECHWQHVNNLSAPAADMTRRTINTTESLSGFGQVQVNSGNAVDFTIQGNSVIRGSVFGGGNASEVKGNVQLKLLDNTKVYGSVFGGGNTARVRGSINVQVGNSATH